MSVQNHTHGLSGSAALRKRSHRAAAAVLTAVALGFTVLFLPSCEKLDLQNRYEKVCTEYFDTVTYLTVYASGERQAEEYFSVMTGVLADYDRLCNRYTAPEDAPDGVAAVNAAAGKTVSVDPRLIDVLKFAEKMHTETSEKLNVLLGPVTSLWHDCREAAAEDPSSAYLPSEDVLKKAGEHISIGSLLIDREKSTVTLTDPEASIDLGAIAKGYAVEQAAQAAEEAGICAIINAGGNVRAAGWKYNDGKSGWVIGIADPFEPSKIVTAVSVPKGTACVTSGDYQRYFEVDGQRYSHLIDPLTLCPADRFSSVTVIVGQEGAASNAGASAVADALATALFLLPKESGAELAGRYGAAVLWITPDGERMTCGGFESFENDAKNAG